MLLVETEPLEEVPVHDVDIDSDALACQIDGFAHQVFTSLDVGCVEPLGTNLKAAAVGDFAQALHAALGVAHMKVRQTRLAAEHATVMRVVDDPGQLPRGRLGRTLVRDGDLAAPDDLGDEHDVVSHRTSDRGRRHVVPAGPHPCGETLLAEALNLGQQSGERLHRGVDAETADHGGDAAGYDFTEGDFRGLGREATFAAAAQQVLVRVNQTGGHHATTGVDYLDGQTGGLECAAAYVAYETYLPIDQKDRGTPTLLGGVKITIFNQGKHISISATSHVSIVNRPARICDSRHKGLLPRRWAPGACILGATRETSGQPNRRAAGGETEGLHYSGGWRRGEDWRYPYP